MGLYLLVFITMYFVTRELYSFTKLRHAFLSQNHPHLMTALVEEIPSGAV